MMLRHAMMLALVRMMRSRGWVCQSLALFAIMAPLLIILGLKCGIVEAMKERLLKDPSSLEIRIMDAVQVDDRLLAQVRGWPETAFAIPSTGYIYSVVDVKRETGNEWEEAELIPTAEGDPLLKNTGLPTPGEGQLVLTEKLAQMLGVKLGDQVTVRAWRNARREYEDCPMQVVGILPLQHHQGTALLVPLELTVHLENFIISGNGLPGSEALLTGKLYDGVALESGLKQEAVSDLVKGFREMSVCVNDQNTLPGVADGGTLVRSQDGRMTTVQASKLIALAGEQGAAAWPWVEEQEVSMVVGEKSDTIRVVGSIGKVNAPGRLEAPPVIRLHTGYVEQDHVELRVGCAQGDSSIVCRVEDSDEVPEGEARVTPQLLALLRLGRERTLDWDYRRGGLRFPVLSYISMRVYADSLEHTETLLERMQGCGIPCRARIGVIRQVLSLERSLNKLFYVITAGAAFGAIISFGLSLFNAAELHRKDYALVQLLGMGRVSLAVMPLVDALVTAALALLLAFTCFCAVSSIIGMLFADTAGSGALCRLHAEHIVLFCTSVFILTCAAALAAAFKVMCISPSEIIHES